MTVIPYFIRLNYEFGRASYCAATGFDHRAGWVAGFALLPLVTALALHLINKTWAPGPMFQHAARRSDWRLRLALDAGVATLCWKS